MILSLPDDKREKFLYEVHLMVVALKKPKLTYEQLVALPIDKFLTCLNKFRDTYNEQNLKIPNTKPKEGISFVKEEDFMKKKAMDIEFSKVGG